MLQYLCRRQSPYALRCRRILGRTQQEVVLPVRLQPHRRAGEGIHAFVDEGQRQPGLEGVDAVVRRRVRVLLPLRLPMLAGRGLRGRKFLACLPRLDPAVSQ